jgi:hypothetical protein
LRFKSTCLLAVLAESNWVNPSAWRSTGFHASSIPASIRTHTADLTSLQDIVEEKGVLTTLFGYQPDRLHWLLSNWSELYLSKHQTVRVPLAFADERGKALHESMFSRKLPSARPLFSPLMDSTGLNVLSEDWFSLLINDATSLSTRFRAVPPFTVPLFR